MNKLKLRLSEKRTLDVDIPVLKKRLSAFYLLDFLQYIVILSGVVIAVYGLFNDGFDNIDLFTFVMKLTAILAAVQIIKAILGGLRYFPESRFDLFSLLLLIGLISTLLVKQFFDLVTDEGMFPNSYYWQLTIWGILTLLLFSYLFDIFSRNKVWLAFLGGFSMVCFEIGLVVELIISGDIYSDAAIMLLVMTPVLSLPVFLIENLRVKLVLFVNAFLLALLGFLNLDADFLFFFSAAYVSLALFLFGTSKLSVQDFKDLFSRVLDSEFEKIDMDKVSLLSFPLVGAVTGLAGGILAIVQDSSGLVWLGLDENRDVLKDIEDLNTFLIGDSFKYGNITDISNLFMSYGFLGLALILLMLVMILYSQAKLFLFRKGKKGEQNKGLYFFGLSSYVSTILLVIIGFFANIPITALILGFGLTGVTAAIYAIVNRKTIQHEFIKFEKEAKGRPFGRYYKWIRYVFVIGVVVGLVYFSMKFDSIFLEK